MPAASGTAFFLDPVHPAMGVAAQKSAFYQTPVQICPKSVLPSESKSEAAIFRRSQMPCSPFLR